MPSSPRTLTARIRHWPLARPFAIARGVKTSADVVEVAIAEDQWTGRAECVPYPRYGESPDSVQAQIASVRAEIDGGAGRQRLQDLLPPGAARNAIDCALWDLAARQANQSLASFARVKVPARIVTAVTISLGDPDVMASDARAAVARGAQLLKVKLDGEAILDRMRAVRAAAPQVRIMADANEAWSLTQLEAVHRTLAELGVEMIEQPLPAGQDEALARFNSAVPLCADESCHTRKELAVARQRYQVVNIKLDKAGGLTEALQLAAAAREAGLGIMVGCMVGSSLAMRPALLLTEGARIVDLDGPLWLKEDSQPALRFDKGVILTD